MVLKTSTSFSCNSELGLGVENETVVTGVAQKSKLKVTIKSWSGCAVWKVEMKEISVSRYETQHLPTIQRLGIWHFTF